MTCQAVIDLQENTRRGVLSLIHYDKGDKKKPIDRLIEPRSLMDGAAGLLVRSVQFEPERGMRCFYSVRIQNVRATEHPLRTPNNCFCDGELAVMKRTGKGAPASSAAPWFVEYASAVRDSVIDLHVESDEVDRIERLQRKLKLSTDQVRAVHGYVFAEFLLGHAADGKIDPDEEEQIELVAAGLEQLGWRPG